jgi:hypothetical protein
VSPVNVSEEDVFDSAAFSPAGSGLSMKNNAGDSYLNMFF